MYRRSITRNHRTAFVLLIDTSGSMNEKITFHGRVCSKAEAVSTITNELLFELIARARRTSGLRDYYDIAVIGYGGDDEVYSLLQGDNMFHSMRELNDYPLTIREELVEVRKPNGAIDLRSITSPSWILPKADGKTPMLKALRTARELVREWALRPENRDSFPPTIFNITDGGLSDGSEEDLLDAAELIREVCTNDGDTLLINIHIASENSEQSLFFPTRKEGLDIGHNAAILYECSSVMPSAFNDAIRAIKGPYANPPFRGMSYNASASELIAMLDIGSISTKLE